MIVFNNVDMKYQLWVTSLLGYVINRKEYIPYTKMKTFSLRMERIITIASYSTWPEFGFELRSPYMMKYQLRLGRCAVFALLVNKDHGLN